MPSNSIHPASAPHGLCPKDCRKPAVSLDYVRPKELGNGGSRVSGVQDRLNASQAVHKLGEKSAKLLTHCKSYCSLAEVLVIETLLAEGGFLFKT
jgi:hypothetical protein